MVAVDPHRRHFPAAVRRLLRARDGVCRFPLCDAPPIRHDDHVIAVALGGRTSAGNGQGLCARHNPDQGAPRLAGPRGGRRAGTGHETVTTTGHRHRSPAPPVQEVFTADPEPVEYLDTG